MRDTPRVQMGRGAPLPPPRNPAKKHAWKVADVKPPPPAALGSLPPPTPCASLDLGRMKQNSTVFLVQKKPPAVPLSEVQNPVLIKPKTWPVAPLSCGGVGRSYYNDLRYIGVGERIKDKQSPLSCLPSRKMPRLERVSSPCPQAKSKEH